MSAQTKDSSPPTEKDGLRELAELLLQVRQLAGLDASLDASQRAQEKQAD